MAAEMTLGKIHGTVESGNMDRRVHYIKHRLVEAKGTEPSF